MAYSRVNWQDDRTPLSAGNLNHMDEAIYNLSSSIDTFVVGGKIVGSSITDNSISGTKIIYNSIDGNKLSDNAVTDSKISAGAVLTEKIFNGAVTSIKIATKAVTTEKLDDYSVTTIKLAQGAVTGEKISQKTITSDKIYAYGVDEGKTLVSDGSGGVSWKDVSIPTNVVQKITYNGTPYTAVNGNVTIIQAQADFNEENPLSPSYINNKPTQMQLPDPTSEDRNKVVFVDANSEYALGYPNEYRLGSQWLISKSDANGLSIKWIGG